MSKNEQLNIGVVGLGVRSRILLSPILESEYARLAAVCDLNMEAMDRTLKDFKDVKRFDSYEEMLDKGNIDAVILGTPMQMHAPQAIRALERGINVYSEVVAAVSMEQCRELVIACNKSKAKYMLGENFNYMKMVMIVKNIIESNILGEPYYAESEYATNARGMASDGTWRNEWMFGVNGITYGMHNLGPLLTWFKDDRVVRICCEGSGNHYKKPDGNPIVLEDSCVMLAKTEKDRLLKIRIDLQGSRPRLMKFSLQCTKGMFDSARSESENDIIWMEDIGDWSPKSYMDLDKFEGKHLPDIWRKYGEAAGRLRYGGRDFDYIIMMDFIEALYNGRRMPVGIHEAMDMTVPCLLSQESIKLDGKWIEVPDSRTWQAL
ncbi:MAG TPA: Gfo/Idh/MocA family oxidoreductase [Clostridiales bacterium]|nr:Gfo/Idh/MocA family oxidoreductase [Clostridiales bacterium]